ncbi:MAG: RNA polymerase sigma factor [Acidaminococcaceae bacterium]
MKNNRFEKNGQHSALNPYFAILVPAAKNGGKRSMDTICKAFRPLVLSLINRSAYYAIRDDAEDIAYCEIVYSVDIYKGKEYSHFAGYIKERVVYTLKNALRKECLKNSREPVMEENKLEYFEQKDNIEDLLPLLETREAMKKLPANYRRLLECRYLEDYSVKEIAADIGVTHQAVSKMIKNALKQLRLLIYNY